MIKRKYLDVRDVFLFRYWHPYQWPWQKMTVNKINEKRAQWKKANTTGINRDGVEQIPLFHIIFSIDTSFITL